MRVLYHIILVGRSRGSSGLTPYPLSTVDSSSNTPVGSLAAENGSHSRYPSPLRPSLPWPTENGSHYRRVSLVSEKQQKIKNSVISLGYYSDKQ